MTTENPNLYTQMPTLIKKAWLCRSIAPMVFSFVIFTFASCGGSPSKNLEDQFRAQMAVFADLHAAAADPKGEDERLEARQKAVAELVALGRPALKIIKAVPETAYHDQVRGVPIAATAEAIDRIVEQSTRKPDEKDAIPTKKLALEWGKARTGMLHEAISEYVQHYAVPPLGGDDHVTATDAKFVRILSGESKASNPAGLNLLPGIDSHSLSLPEGIKDAWGNTLRVGIDGNFDGEVQESPDDRSVLAKVKLGEGLVRSAGPDGDFDTKDDFVEGLAN